MLYFLGFSKEKLCRNSTMEKDIICGYCTLNDTFQEVIHHLFNEHPEKTIKYRERFLCAKSGKKLLISKILQFKPTDISINNILIDEISAIFPLDI